MPSKHKKDKGTKRRREGENAMYLMRKLNALVHSFLPEGTAVSAKPDKRPRGSDADVKSKKAKKSKKDKKAKKAKGRSSGALDINAMFASAKKKDAAAAAAIAAAIMAVYWVLAGDGPADSSAACVAWDTTDPALDQSDTASEDAGSFSGA